jgi:hypothetical protein
VRFRSFLAYWPIAVRGALGDRCPNAPTVPREPSERTSNVAGAGARASSVGAERPAPPPTALRVPARLRVGGGRPAGILAAPAPHRSRCGLRFGALKRARDGTISSARGDCVIATHISRLQPSAAGRAPRVRVPRPTGRLVIDLDTDADRLRRDRSRLTRRVAFSPAARPVRGAETGMNPRPTAIELVADGLHYVLSSNR